MMRHRVRRSSGSAAFTIIVVSLLLALLVYFLRSGDTICVWTIGAALGILVAGALYFTPLAVSVDSRNLSVHRPMSANSISLNDICDVKLCPPTMGARRIVGSGGFAGSWWGWFSEEDTGKYFAYYGKSSDCFLVTLKSGRKYMIGCENPDVIVDCIRKAIGQNL